MLRDEPSIITKHADLISFAFMVGPLLWSGLVALRAWRRQGQKARIENYFARIAALSIVARSVKGEEDRTRLLRDLNAVEAEAMNELAAERLEAGPAFSILQDGRHTLKTDLLRSPILT
jgi:hypothetical protein